MLIIDFIRGVKKDSVPLSERQLSNLEKILSISKDFHKEAGIPYPENAPTNGSLVVESGHQTNYFPHAGTYKKPFLEDHIARIDKDAICLFGFPDYNLSTAKILYKNKIPAANKTGFESIGHNIRKEDVWKAFNKIRTPTKEDVSKEIEKLKKYYKDVSSIEEILYGAQSKAANNADYNAYLFSGMCSHLGINTVFFFRYSDVQKAGLFIDEYNKIITNLEKYNIVYNRVVTEKKIEDMKVVEKDHVPFWLDCKCGCKTMLQYKNDTLTGSCISCKENYSFTLAETKTHYANINPNAVSRNLVYSEGLGVSLFISGSGGGLRYGQISDALSKELGFNLPVTFAWRSKDYYLGNAHNQIIHNLKKNLSIGALSNKDEITAKITAQKKELTEKISATVDKKEAQKYQGQLVSLDIEASIASEVFSLTPSFLDEYLTIGPENVKAAWTKALSDLEINPATGTALAKKNITYGPEAEAIYTALTGLAEKKN